jgi:hypothetical protein
MGDITDMIFGWDLFDTDLSDYVWENRLIPSREEYRAWAIARRPTAEEVFADIEIPIEEDYSI